jgi:hypothetical protein
MPDEKTVKTNECKILSHDSEKHWDCYWCIGVWEDVALHRIAEKWDRESGSWDVGLIIVRGI